MIVGLNARHEHGDILAGVQARHWQSFRVGLLDNLSIDAQRYWLTAAAEIGVPLAIVTGGDQVRALGRDYVHQAELWNEPNGTIDRYFEPAEYAALVPDFVAACAEVWAVPWRAERPYLRRQCALLPALRALGNAAPRLSLARARDRGVQSHDRPAAVDRDGAG